MRETLPQAVRVMLADPEMRTHHYNWHLVRIPDALSKLTAQERSALEEQGWKAPRAQGDPGSGIDFFHMHRQMIAHVNAMLSGNAQYPRIVGWPAIPATTDPDWPVPPLWPKADPGFATAKSDAALAYYVALAADRYVKDDWLRNHTLDEVGREMETGVHGWMHVRWSSDPWYPPYKHADAAGRDMNDIRNDFLGFFYSSHVNDTFWKLHGWIDGRITAWEKARGEQADWTGAWDGPSHLTHMMAKTLAFAIKPPDRMISAEAEQVLRKSLWIIPKEL